MADCVYCKQRTAQFPAACSRECEASCTSPSQKQFGAESHLAVLLLLATHIRSGRKH